MLKFSGSYVAIATPFNKDFSVDYGRLKELVEFHYESGTTGIVPCGTTGESATLTHEEHKKVVETVVETSGGRLSVLAGSGSNSTDEALDLTIHTRESGADGCLVITPYYNKPTQEGMYRHFSFLADKVGHPMVVYNVPGRTGVNLAAGTLARLSEHPAIVGVKEASGDLAQISQIIKRTAEDFAVFSGDDALTLPILALGGIGVISVAANIIPADLAELVSSYLAGDSARARQLQAEMIDLFQVMFIETNPVPVKEAMNLMGMNVGPVRLPLCELTDSNRDALAGTLVDYGLKLVS
ncbi:4-hydroxy-tetrahydrodipicolinate synthase [candidate division KSB1 bacterium]